MDKTALTIDYEFDWGGRIKSVYAIEKMIYKVLHILEKQNSKTTFFISTETVKKTKKIILDIYKSGHEISSHGHEHNIRYDLLSKKELEFQISVSKKILEDLISDRIYGFRTPQFRKNKYLEELLLKYDYLYDSSSVNTNFLNRYNKNQYEFGIVKNFPVSTIFGKIPAGLKWINLFGNYIRTDNNVKVVYMHLFDLLSIKDILLLYDKQIISKLVLLFYLIRKENLLKTFRKICLYSNPLKFLINKDSP